MEHREDITDSAVLVPFYFGDDGNATVVLVRRSDKIVHGGEIAFPGGKRISADRSMRDTALREVREEIGLGSESIDILGDLPPVETISTGFRIHPYLARIVPMRTWRPDGNEIAEVLEVPVRSLAEPDARGEEFRVLESFPEPLRISFYRIGAYKLWGATYRILRPLVPRFMKGEWNV
ncbi:MAG: CoA pyrophosphatase [Candidatus Latescibacterota bacterium]